MPEAHHDRERLLNYNTLEETAFIAFTFSCFRQLQVFKNQIITNLQYVITNIERINFITELTLYKSVK